MGIDQEQNRPANIEKLAAQRNLYSTAKRIIGLQMILSGPVAVSATVLGLLKPEYKGYVVLWGLSVLALDLLVFNPWQKKLRENAAKIQELFDCTVFGLPWNEIKAGKKPDPELIHERAGKYRQSGESVPGLQTWYPAGADSVPHDWGVVICQRANVYWDSKLRRRYAAAVTGSAIVVTLILVWVAFHKNINAIEFVTLVAAPMASAYVLAYRQFTEHRDAAERLDKLKDHSDKLFTEAIAGGSVAAIKSKSRLLQDEIFDGRKRNPPIFDFIFKMLRPQNELEMNVGAEALVSEAQSAVRKSPV
ncbi:S-4TM family putative pore-forming effector [Cupriavidus oxalaticus]|uniref:S-4TM family putative pore-forming effector n=1 Tax=Cupriavidus oxalaticus TaxID=96344 RepID=UPI0040331FFD